MIDHKTREHIKKCQDIYNRTYRIFAGQYGAYRADRLAASEVRRYLDSNRSNELTQHQDNTDKVSAG